MQSSYRQTSSTSNLRSSSFVITTESRQQVGRGFGRQIQAQSSSSVDVKAQQKQELIMKILMMSFQIQRKDVVVKNLLKQLQMLSTKNQFSSSQEFYSLQQELTKVRRITEDLEFKCSQLQLINKQLSLSQKQNSRELQDRIVFLETRNKELQLKKIQIQLEFQKIITQNKMLNFKLFNAQSTEKGKNREMNNQVNNLLKKIDDQKKVATQFKIIIQSSYEEIRVLRQNQQRMSKQFEQRVRSLQNQLHHRQDLKRSQAVNSQQQIQMTQQQLMRMQDQIRFLRKIIDDQQVLVERKQQQFSIGLKKSKDIQNELFQTRHQNTLLRNQMDQKVGEINNLARQLNEAKSAYSDLQRSRQISEMQNVQSFDRKVYLIQQQVQKNYRQRANVLQKQLEIYKTQNRKLKRKPSQLVSNECNSCKIMQSMSTTKSKKVINGLNLNQIIEQTQKLHNGTLKIEQILLSKAINMTAFESRMSLDQTYTYQE